MANTTNFGWETPDDTDLVKDGASAMRTLGNAIDTSLVDLKGGTTGQVLSKASNTDMDFTWVAQDDSNAIQNAIVDAKGDLITATAADTPARLAVGSNDQVLMADSSTATGLKWGTVSGGGMTLLSTTTLSGASVSLTSIPSGYVNLVLHIVKFLPATDSTSVRYQFNSDANANYYRAMTWAGPSPDGGGDSDMIASSTVSNTDAIFNYSVVTIYDYANTTTKKMTTYIALNTDPTSTTSVKSASGFNTWDSTNAITSIQLFMNSGNFTSGTVLLYGVK